MQPDAQLRSDPIAYRLFGGQQGRCRHGAVFHGAEIVMVHVRAEIASGTPTTATLRGLSRNLSDGSDRLGCRMDNTGTAIGATLNVHTVAVDSYARVEGIMLNNRATAGNASGWTQALSCASCYTPAFTGGSSPAILAYAEFIGAPGTGSASRSHSRQQYLALHPRFAS